MGSALPNWGARAPHVTWPSIFGNFWWGALPPRGERCGERLSAALRAPADFIGPENWYHARERAAGHRAGLVRLANKIGSALRVG